MNARDMTSQELFTTIVTHLRQQGAKSLYEDADGDMSCAYRGDTGLKCAAGCLIPDNEYDSGDEGNTWWAIPFFKGFSAGAGHVIGRMQKLHDRDSPATWEERYEEAAEELNLTVPPKVES